MKIIEYKIVRSDNYATLETLVNQAILLRWRPFGGISINSVTEYQNATAAQALVRYQ